MEAFSVITKLCMDLCLKLYSGLGWRKFAAMDQFEDDLERLAASGLQSAR